jgi:branched chain amino acid efflux pump
MTTWLVILSVGAGSFVLRALPLFLDGRWTQSARVERTTAYAATAATAALVASALQRGGAASGHAPALVAAAAIALLVALSRASMLRVLVVGSVGYAGLLALGGLFS